MPVLSFTVKKDRAGSMTMISFKSRGLKQVICKILGLSTVPPLQLTLSIGQVLQHYDDLRSELDNPAYCHPYDDTYKEIRLLVDDILLDRSLYDGFNMGRLRQQGIMTATLLRHIHQRNMDVGVIDLEECFQLGETSEEKANEYLSTQNAQIDKLARTGRLDLLSEFCEPLLRSQDVHVLYNPDLLSQMLDNGYLDIFKYILDLVERTRPMEDRVLNPDHADITYDPLCVAIRLGHYRTVEHFVRDKSYTFSGYIGDTVDNRDRVFTPLLVAVLWQQADIIRLLLRDSPMYRSELVQANYFAADMGYTHILDVLADLPKQTTLASEAMSAKYPVPKPPQLSPMRQSSFCNTTISPSPENRTMSGISNALYGSWQDQRMQADVESFVPCLSVASPETPLETVFSPEVPELYVSPQDLSISSQFSSPVSSSQFHPSPASHVQAEPSRYLPSRQAPRESLARPMFLRYTQSYKRKSHLGRSSMFRLQRSCRRIQVLCDQHPGLGDYDVIRDHCTVAMNVYKSGLNCLRNLLRNHAPSGIVPVLQALIVADALICQLPESRERDME